MANWQAKARPRGAAARLAKSLLFSFKDASREDVQQRCQACHEAQSGSMHAEHTTSCISCHAAHRYQQKKFILAQVPPQLCTDCHDRRR
jgi:predicted CXXCH cytochrome family protein